MMSIQIVVKVGLQSSTQDITSQVQSIFQFNYYVKIFLQAPKELQN